MKKKKIQKVDTGDPTYLRSEKEDLETKLNHKTKY